MMEDGGLPPPRRLLLQLNEALLIPDNVTVRRIVVFLPDDPLWLLLTLQQAALLLKHSAIPLPMLILSRSPANWLWETLLHHVSNPRHLALVRAVASDLPCRQLAELLSPDGGQSYPLLEQLKFQERGICDKPAAGLSKPELSTALDWLRGLSINYLAQRRGLSHKTLYAQRSSGLKKMVEHHPHLGRRFPGCHTKGQITSAVAALSAFEREFIHAIHCRQIFPVFQPITDGKLMLQGIEVLSRWRRNGNVLYPSEFLPKIRSEYVWLLLTAFVLQEAVQNINQYPGGYYFAINIPPLIATNANIIRMMKAARKQLLKQQHGERLVLEFAETVDLNLHSKVGDTINHLQQQGFRIMLDDCFSRSSVLFPVRTVRFNEYKLDISIVNDLQRDPHALALIKSLIYYCQLSGSRCIAEGVDSLEKFNMLKALGIDRFQGYIISPPVTGDNLEYIIQRFSQGDHPTSIAR